MSHLTNGGQILVSASFEEKSAPYVAALQAIGIPAERITVLLPDAAGIASARERIAAAAGLVLTGGADVEPKRYGEEPLASARLETIPDRDALEWELLAGARERRIPAWCICRGIQVLNVFLGGSLWQDIPSQLPAPAAAAAPREPVDHEIYDTPETLAHKVWVTDPDTALGARLAGEPIRVNSRHHQAIKRLAPGLRAAAVSPDGLVEAAELDSKGDSWWVRAVQWHPENLIAMAPQKALWDDFGAALAGRQAGSRRSARSAP
ncbi:MAG TPA: gamma-glutamyl-gamma-aminobutyrate hydrolase family protein [Thermoanaerobaculia bacterium]|nr:gamma-glutamyl-gamma-aminobutyrate hydrolase family protein [Thermoanaerobaculia bacterium]